MMEMKNVKALPKLTKELTLTVILYIILLVLWNVVIKDNIVLSDQGLSAVGLAVSAAIGVLTAIVVSFVLVIWQWSREARSAAFWHWRNALEQLVKFYDTNLMVLWDIRDEVAELTMKLAGVSLITPMSRNTFKELIDKVNRRMETPDNNPTVEPSKEDVVKQQAYMYLSSYLHVLGTANFEHRSSHDSYKQILRMEGLLYRLLVVLSASVITVAVSATNTPKGLADGFNAPFAAILLLWVVYVLLQLGKEIKAVVFLEKQFRGVPEYNGSIT